MGSVLQCRRGGLRTRFKDPKTAPNGPQEAHRRKQPAPYGRMFPLAALCWGLRGIGFLILAQKAGRPTFSETANAASRGAQDDSRRAPRRPQKGSKVCSSICVKTSIRCYARRRPHKKNPKTVPKTSRRPKKDKECAHFLLGSCRPDQWAQTKPRRSVRRGRAPTQTPGHPRPAKTRPPHFHRILMRLSGRLHEDVHRIFI